MEKTHGQCIRGAGDPKFRALGAEDRGVALLWGRGTPLVAIWKGESRVGVVVYVCRRPVTVG